MNRLLRVPRSLFMDNAKQAIADYFLLSVSAAEALSARFLTTDLRLSIQVPPVCSISALL